MKKLVYFLVILELVLTGCTKDDEENTEEISTTTLIEQETTMDYEVVINENVTIETSVSEVEETGITFIKDNGEVVTGVSNEYGIFEHWDAEQEEEYYLTDTIDKDLLAKGDLDDSVLIDVDTEIYEKAVNDIVYNNCIIDYEKVNKCSSGDTVYNYHYYKQGVNELVTIDNDEISLLINEVDGYYLNSRTKKFISFTSVKNSADLHADFLDIETELPNILTGSVIENECSIQINGEDYNRYCITSTLGNTHYVYFKNTELKKITLIDFVGYSEITIKNFSKNLTDSSVFTIPIDYVEVTNMHELYN